MTTNSFDVTAVTAGNIVFDYNPGGVHYSVTVTGDALPVDVPVALYWGSGSTSNNQLSTVTLGKVTDATIPAGTTALYTADVGGSLLVGAPANASYLILVVEPDGTLEDTDSAISVPIMLPVYPLFQGALGTRPWWNIPLGQGQNADQGSPIDTIGDSGCALTALAMQLSYNDIFYNGSSPDPGLLNAELQNVSGAFLPDSKGRLTRLNLPIAAAGAITNADYFGSLTTGLQWQDFETSDPQTLRDKLLSTGEPIMVRVTDPTSGHHHYVLVTGLAGNNDFTIIDPGYVNNPRKYLSYYTNNGNGFQTRGYIGDPADVSILDLAFVSDNPNPAVIVTDSQGNETGIGESGQSVNQIPNSFSYVDGPLENLDGPSDDDSYTEFVDIYQPASGSYSVSISGPDGQSYLLAASFVAPDGAVQPQQTIVGQTSDLAAQYQVVLDPSHGLQPILVGTSTEVASDHLSGSVYGQAVTFTASVSASPSFTSSSADSVQFQVDGSNFGSPVPLRAYASQ